MRMNPTIPSGNPASIGLGDADSRALGRFLRNAYDVQHALMGGVVIGELRQTLQTIRNPAKGLRELVDKWRGTAIRLRRRRNFLPIGQHKASVLENLADAWLEVQYGWRPLMSDIRGGAEALNRYYAAQGLSTRRITGTGKAEANVGSELVEEHTHNNVIFYNHVERTASHSIVIYRGAMRVQVKDPKTMDPALLGFDLASWAPTAWELIPYSFLIDYFSNIGDIILGWSSLGTKFSWVNKTTVRYYEKVSMTQPHPQWQKAGTDWDSGAIEILSYAPAKVVIQKRSVSRNKYEGLLIPDLDFEIPGLGSLKWLNIAALIAARKGDRSWSFD
jgi:hypothetical protein